MTTVKTYFIVKYNTDNSFSLTACNNSLDRVIIGRRYIGANGKRYPQAKSKLTGLKRRLNTCLQNDWCIAFALNEDTGEFTAEVVKDMSTAFESSPEYTVERNNNGGFYLDKGKRGIYHDVTISGTTIVDCRSGWGDWRTYMSEADLKHMKQVTDTLSVCAEQGLKVKLNYNSQSPQKLPIIRVINF